MTKKEIADIRRLSQKKQRIEQGVFVAEGTKAIKEIMLAGLSARKMFVTSQSVANEFPRIASKEVISEEEMKKISFLQTPTSSLALFNIPQTPSLAQLPEKELTLILDGIQDPGNLGTIIRLADWFGVNTIVCSEVSADCYNPKVVQATMGAIARINIIYSDLVSLLTDARQRSIPIYGTFMEGENIYSSALSPSGALVMGNEGSGICAEIESLVSHKITIPSFKKENVESLNVAIATSICCSEFRRRGLAI